jgi:hypothetical protein
MEKKETLPNSTAVLVLGICSIVFGCFFIGMILGIVGLNLAGKGRRLYRSNPDLYDGYGALNAGYIMSIIGTILGSLYTIYFIFVALIFGGAAFSILNM